MENIDYEKLYKSALAKAKDLHDKHGLGQTQVWTVCEELFPELKEREDEKIRKELLDAVKNSEYSLYMVMTPTKRQSIIDWLEKQKSSEWTIEDERIYETILNDAVKRDMALTNTQKSWFQSLKQKRRWKPTDKQLEALRAAAYESYELDYDSLQSLYLDIKKSQS